MEPTLEQLQYPVGKWKWPTHESVTQDQIRLAINTIAIFPADMMEAVKDLTEDQLNTPYRLDGWTIRQVVHHTADSHMNAYMRFKLALTEDNPIIRPYDQTKWAELIDSKELPEISLFILTGIHKRWVALMKNMSVSDWARPLKHPEHDRQLTLAMISQQYKWHCEHHLQHIIRLKERKGWQ